MDRPTMAILLVHLRRLILLLSIVYLSGVFLQKLLNDSRHSYLVHLNAKMLWAKHLHFQWWAYIYTGYAYVILVNYASLRRIASMLELIPS